MNRDSSFAVLVDDCPEFPTPNQVVIHTDKLRLRRLARGRKT